MTEKEEGTNTVDALRLSCMMDERRRGERELIRVFLGRASLTRATGCGSMQAVVRSLSPLHQTLHQTLSISMIIMSEAIVQALLFKPRYLLSCPLLEEVAQRTHIQLANRNVRPEEGVQQFTPELLLT